MDEFESGPKPIEKKAQAKSIKKDPVKIYFDVKVETMVPATVTWRVLAETPEQAAELVKNKPPTNISYKFLARRDSITKVYDAGSCIIKFIKKIVK